jgi:hypothetical protein
MPFISIIGRFNVYGFLHREYIPVYIQQDATLHSLFISANCCTCFGWYFYPSSGEHTTVSTASGICHAVTAIWPSSSGPSSLGTLKNKRISSETSEATRPKSQRHTQRLKILVNSWTYRYSICKLDSLTVKLKAL